jgi:hypothetical protein
MSVTWPAALSMVTEVVEEVATEQAVHSRLA